MTTNNNKLYSALGLAMKAGKIKTGEFAVKKAFDHGQACLIVIDSSASESTRKRWRDACEYKKVPFLEIEAPGVAIGRESIMTVCVISSDFARMILDAGQNYTYYDKEN